MVNSPSSAWPSCKSETPFFFFFFGFYLKKRCVMWIHCIVKPMNEKQTPWPPFVLFLSLRLPILLLLLLLFLKIKSHKLFSLPLSLLGDYQMDLWPSNISLFLSFSLSLPPRWHEKKELEDKKIIFVCVCVCVCWISVMGAESSTAMNSDGNNKNVETQVVLNVYDLTPINNYMVWFGFGIFHSGIEGW